MAEIGSNIEGLNEKIREMAVDYAKCDEESMGLNARRAEIRDRAKGLGLDTKAFQDCINRMKADLNKKEGYDESVSIINAALANEMPESLFAHVERARLAKEHAREAKRKEREAEAKNNDTFKPATERKPKEAKSLGKALSEAHPVLQ
jgi:uncharacterized protein (UPF0335 family)